MTKLNLKPNSRELRKILKNKFLFTYYVDMINKDNEEKWELFKYLGMLTNFEGYKQIERLKESPKVINIFRPDSDGIEATKRIREFYKSDEKEGIEDVG